MYYCPHCKRYVEARAELIGGRTVYQCADCGESVYILELAHV